MRPETIDLLTLCARAARASLLGLLQCAQDLLRPDHPKLQEFLRALHVPEKSTAPDLTDQAGRQPQ